MSPQSPRILSRTLTFIPGLLGLRFVKRTINFDDPGTYHFYFGDDAGSPGTILTFFPWRTYWGKGAWVSARLLLRRSASQQRRCRTGSAACETRAFRSNARSRASTNTVLKFADPDGMRLELVGQIAAASEMAPRNSDVPKEHAIRGFFGGDTLRGRL